MQARAYHIDVLELGPMQNFVYLIRDTATDRAAVVDPAWEPEKILDLARQRDVRITDILLTHSHHDHINGVETVLAETDAQVHLLKPEAQFWGRCLDLPTLHHGGDRIHLGQTEIEVLHTPGHTPGSACYRLGGDVITGDTLFVFGCGRCDLAGGDPEQMYHTLRHLAEHLPSETVVYPGHNYAVQPTCTMAEQVRGNPYYHRDRVDRFVQFRMHGPRRSTPYRAEPPAD